MVKLDKENVGKKTEMLNEVRDKYDLKKLRVGSRKGIIFIKCSVIFITFKFNDE